MTQLEPTAEPETLGRYLRARQDDILRDWSAAVRGLPGLRELPEARLLDGVPDMLRLVTRLVEAGSLAAMDSVVLEEHAVDRRRRSVELRDVMTELALLRRCIMERFERDLRACTIREVRILDAAIDRAMVAAVDHYVATTVRVLCALDRVSTSTLNASHVGEAFDALARAVIDELPSLDVSVVFLVEDGVVAVRGCVGADQALRGVSEPIGEGFAGRVAAEARPIVARREELSGAWSRLGVTSLYGIPLRHGGELLGVACIGSHESTALSELDRQVLDSVAVRAAGAVHLQMLRDASERRARLLEESEARTQELLDSQRASMERARFLARAGRLLASSLEYRATLRTLTEMAVPELADLCAVDVLREDGSLGEHVAVAHRDPDEVEMVRALRRRYGPPKQLLDVLERRQTMFLPEVTEEELRTAARDDEHLAALRAFTARSAIVVPLVARDRVLGAISLARVEPARPFQQQDVEAAEELARMAGTAIENARLYEEKERAVEVRDRVLAMVSHDLRTPLTAIDLSGAVLQERPQVKSDSFAVKQMDVIRRNAARMSRLVADLLDLASLQAGRLALEQRPSALAALVEECVEPQRAIATERGVEVVVEVEADVQVWSDRDRVHQVMSNLLGNAIKFCPSGGTVTVRAGELDDSQAVVRVIDTGPGIEAEQLPHVFDIFWKGRDGGRRGAGVGLYVARGIVEAQGGRMWVRSEPGCGSEFSFTLRRVGRTGGP